MNSFQRAVKNKAKLRCAIYGVSGSGKTYTALRIATGMVKNGGKIGVIDTEEGSASLYADRFNFDVMNLESVSIQGEGGYVEAINIAAREGYDVLIIDSITHAWDELKDEVNRATKMSRSGNSWSEWSNATPKHKSLINAMLRYPGHIIATMRSKTEWTYEQGANGKMRPIRLGMAPDQRSGTEYEFSLLLEMSQDHVGQVVKDRTGKFQDKIIEKPSELFGEDLVKWLNEGKNVPTPDFAIAPFGESKGLQWSELPRETCEKAFEYFVRHTEKPYAVEYAACIRETLETSSEYSQTETTDNVPIENIKEGEEPKLEDGENPFAGISEQEEDEHGAFEFPEDTNVKPSKNTRTKQNVADSNAKYTKDFGGKSDKVLIAQWIHHTAGTSDSGIHKDEVAAIERELTTRGYVLHDSKWKKGGAHE